MIKKIRENNKTKLILTLGVWLLYIVWLLKFSSVKLDLANVLCYVGFLGLLLFIYFDDFKSYFKDFKKNLKKNILTVFVYFLIFIVILVVSNILISILLPLNPDSGNSAIYDLFSNVPLGTIFACFLTIFFYPIVEELVFRKSLRDVIKNPIVFIILSSLISWYFQVTLINPKLSEFILTSQFFFNSIFAAIIFVKKNNLLYAIFPRMLYNFFICLMQIIALFK